MSSMPRSPTWFAACRWHDEQVTVGADGLHLINIAAVSNLVPVGRERILVLPAKAERRNVMAARCQITCDAAVHRDQEKVTVLAVEVVRPVAIHQLGEDLSFHL